MPLPAKALCMEGVDMGEAKTHTFKDHFEIDWHLRFGLTMRFNDLFVGVLLISALHTGVISAAFRAYCKPAQHGSLVVRRTTSVQSIGLLIVHQLERVSVPAIRHGRLLDQEH